MPIFMDRHDVSETVTAEHVAQIHQEDLKIQHKFACRGLTYWFDEKRKTAFCLIEAPDEQSIIDMHNEAHGDIPHRIIEVDPLLVESFLGRIEDPVPNEESDLNIINDPALKTLMVTGLKQFTFTDAVEIPGHRLHDCKLAVAGLIKESGGRIVKQNEEYFLSSFDSVTKALSCALSVQSAYQNWINQVDCKNVNLKIGLSAGVPVTEKQAIFEDAVKVAERMYYISNSKIVVSSEVKELYQNENLNVFIDGESVFSLTPSDERFLDLLMDYTEESWQNSELQVDDFGRHLGFSKSQLYRKMISITGLTPNNFIKEFRLNRALSLINKQLGNISEIAFNTGFSSPSYFAKCFQKRYGLLPSEYQRVMEN